MITIKDKVRWLVEANIAKGRDPKQMLIEIVDWNPPKEFVEIKPIVLNELRRWIEKHMKIESV